jgi:hypothetical protein
MEGSIAAQVANLNLMTVNELRAEWRRVFGEETRQRHRQHLINRIAKQLQKDQLPNLSPEEEAKVEEYRAIIQNLQPDQWFPGKQRGKAKRNKPTKTHRIPPPGSVITREYKGQEIIVTILEKGFEFQGQVYRSLSAIAKEVTGTTWNGYTFFRLKKSGAQK